MGVPIAGTGGPSESTPIESKREAVMGDVTETYCRRCARPLDLPAELEEVFKTSPVEIRVFCNESCAGDDITSPNAIRADFLWECYRSIGVMTRGSGKRTSEGESE